MRYFLPLLLFAVCACRNQPAVPKRIQQQLTVQTEQAILYAEPGEKSKEIGALQQGDRLADIGQVSNFETTIQYNLAVRKAPWIKVQTMDNLTGWVFAAAVRPTADQDTWLAQKQLICYLGPSISARRDAWLEKQQHISDEQIFARQYRESVALRDTCIQLLQNHAEPTESAQQDDFNWLRSALPGFVFQWVAEGTQPYLFLDFKQWQPIAAQTPGLQDDLYIQACLTAFAADSIESFFPTWVIQTTDYESASELGTGQHQNVLQAIDRALSAGKLFQPELDQLKEDLLEDILGKNRSYWQPQEKILTELKKILANPPKCLNERDLLALQTRFKSFEAPARSGIRVNLRSGE